MRSAVRRVGLARATALKQRHRSAERWLSRGARRRHRRDERRLGWRCAHRPCSRSRVAAFPLAYTFVGVAAPARFAHAVARAAVHRPRQLREALSRRALLASAGAHVVLRDRERQRSSSRSGLRSRCSCTATSPARGVARTLALLPWAMPTVVAALLWHSCSRARARRPRAERAARCRCRTDLVRRSGARLGADRPRRRVEDDAVRRAAACSRDCRPSTRADRGRAHRRRGALQLLWHVTLPGLGHAAARAAVPRARRVPRLRPGLRAHRRRPGDRDRAALAVRVQTLLRDLRFGYGSALSVIVFLVTALLAALSLRWAGDAAPRRRGGRAMTRAQPTVTRAQLGYARRGVARWRTRAALVAMAGRCSLHSCRSRSCSRARWWRGRRCSRTTRRCSRGASSGCRSAIRWWWRRNDRLVPRPGLAVRVRARALARARAASCCSPRCSGSRCFRKSRSSLRSTWCCARCTYQLVSRVWCCRT